MSGLPTTTTTTTTTRSNPCLGLYSPSSLHLEHRLRRHDDTYQLKANQTLFRRRPFKSAQLQPCRRHRPRIKLTKSCRHSQPVTPRRHRQPKTDQVQSCRRRHRQVAKSHHRNPHLKFTKSRRHRQFAQSSRRPLQDSQVQHHRYPQFAKCRHHRQFAKSRRHRPRPKSMKFRRRLCH